MSTTVTYKGSTLTTIENGTKYLLTAGKYMEDNVTITDVTGGGGSVYIKDTTDVAGGTIREIMSEDEITIDSLSVTQNGTYTAPDGTVYDAVTVNVSGGSTPDGNDYYYGTNPEIAPYVGYGEVDSAVLR